ncbi:alpha/beta fold hydrolase [Phytomonospora endophytica]|uniref:Pimeloyl-ACP methyl ester carboxylesterase n=1 Tax=Phytomonospora endophytica TaxID=714109 RepID=A0A841FQN4_9ACTN|nr:alpha/beta fold hydrolase [Phytomonospora endophytica]MBB6035567.1 pimeloyl-ACP methyl ester carboxylesterase [Phytomonospora endophytica]GIG70070.1 hypothetical protein Pen01_63650 [Phytomonospora endophytica]
MPPDRATCRPSFPCRGPLAARGDRWRLIALDLPGFGNGATPGDSPYTFDGHAAFPGRFTETLGLDRHAVYPHDYGTPFGLRPTMSAPERVAAPIIRNGGPESSPVRTRADRSGGVDGERRESSHAA